VIFEFGFLFLVWNRRFHPLLFISGILLHGGIYMFMNISFLTLSFYYVALINWDKILGIKKEPASLYTLSVFYQLFKKNLLIIIVGGLLLFGNTLYGFAKLQSWPFSCYPVFDIIIPNKWLFIKYEGFSNGQLNEEDIQIRKRIERLMPNFYLRELEYHILDGYRDKDSIKVNKTLKTVFASEKDFKGLDSIRVFQVESGISPEEINTFRNRGYISTVRIK
jgi:hypothetical protein